MITTTPTRKPRIMRYFDRRRRRSANRLQGDKARDRGDWAAAASAYERHLAQWPDDVAIRVQYGHVLKEADRWSDAVAAYQQAIAIKPDAADPKRHLAHLFKSLGEQERALALFADLAAHEPTADVLAELDRGGGHQVIQEAFAVRSSAIPPGSVFIELRDLFQYLTLHSTVTGITRVVLSLIHHIIDVMPADESARYQFVQKYGGGEGVILIPRALLRTAVALALTGERDITAMTSLIGQIRASSPVGRLQRGDVYLIVGAFWEFWATPSWIGGMRQRGVIIGAYIYDLIPITHPQYCTRGLSKAFSIGFAEIVRMLDFALTISAFVADDVRRYLGEHDVEPFPVLPVLLAHELRLKNERHPAIDERSTRRRYLESVPFVLCICTIEARKNHAYLISIWQKLIAGGVEVPDLIFVGRPGWRVEALMEQIDASDHLDGRLHVLFGLSDDEVEDLYRRCLFTVFPSFVEGWGLPVGESLAHGKVCVASSTSSIPEVGGDLVIYVDPHDIDDGTAVIARLLAQPEEIVAREAAIAARFQPRTWENFAQSFFVALDGLRAPLQRDPDRRHLYAPLLASSHILSLTTLGRLDLDNAVYARNPLRLACAAGWRTTDRDGVWMLDPEALLRVRTDLAPFTPVLVVIQVATSPYVAADNVLTVAIGVPENGDGPRYRRPLRSTEMQWITLSGAVDGDGVLSISLAVSGRVVAPAGELPSALSLYAAGYAAAADPAATDRLFRAALRASAIRLPIAPREESSQPTPSA